MCLKLLSNSLRLLLLGNHDLESIEVGGSSSLGLLGNLLSNGSLSELLRDVLSLPLSLKGLLGSVALKTLNDNVGKGDARGRDNLSVDTSGLLWTVNEDTLTVNNVNNSGSLV